MEEQQAKATFLTSDLGEAAYIATVGHPCLDIRPVNGDPRRCAFVFPSEAKKAADDYYCAAVIEAQRLLMVYKELKGRLFRARR